MDLRSGERRPHDSELYLTKMTAVGPSDEDPGLWLRVLDRAFTGEREVIAIAQSDPPDGRVRWTLELIGRRLVKLNIVEDSISYETVRKALKKGISTHTAKSRG